MCNVLGLKLNLTDYIYCVDGSAGNPFDNDDNELQEATTTFRCFITASDTRLIVWSKHGVCLFLPNTLLTVGIMFAPLSVIRVIIFYFVIFQFLNISLNTQDIYSAVYFSFIWQTAKHCDFSKILSRKCTVTPRYLSHRFGPIVKCH